MDLGVAFTHEEKLCRARSLAKSRGAVVHVEDEIAKLIQHYYSCPTIRSRIDEFMGGSAKGDATAVYVVGNDGMSGFTQPVSPDDIGQFLLSGLDVERSLWDRRWLLADLDIDYENFDHPGEPHIRPERASH